MRRTAVAISSLRGRLMAVTIATMAATLLVASLGILWHEHRESRRMALTDLRIQAAMIATNASAAVAFGDRVAAGEILHALDASPGVVSGEIVDAAGVPLARRERPGMGAGAGGELVEVREPIAAGGGAVGEARLVADLDSLREGLLQHMGAMAAVAFAAILVGWLMLRHLVPRLLRPLDRLAAVARQVTESGDFSLRAPDSRDEIGVLARGFNDMLAQIQALDAALAGELAHRRKAEGRLEQLAHFDPVTHLPNRHYFNERIERVLEDSRILESRVALLMIDLDDFKLVNDSLGHHVGDRLLEEVGRLIKGQVRARDTVARLGGDEFAVILEHVRVPEDPRNVAEKILAAFSKPVVVDGHSAHVGVSIGIAVHPSDSRSVAGIVRRADTAMYDAKARGKRGYRFFAPEMDQRMQRRLKVEAELRLAAGRGELYLEYQPQVELASGTCAGIEALVRWRHPGRGVVSPRDFIGVAEDSGLIVDVGHFVLESAIAQVRVWQEQGLVPGQMAVNVSTRQFESDAFVAFVLDALDRHGVEPGALELEITESLLMGGTEALARIEALHRAGVRFAIDDFGTGYSSLSYLKRVPIRTLKIDRHFIRDIGQSPEDRAITQAIIAMARSLGLRTVAEGVETGAALDLLRQMGCTMGQGYAIARPLPAEAAAAFLRSWAPAAGVPESPAATAQPGATIH